MNFFKRFEIASSEFRVHSSRSSLDGLFLNTKPGINEANALQLKGSGIKGIAVVSAVFANDDPQTAATGLKRIVARIVSS